MPDLKEAIAQVQRFAPFMQAVIDLAATAETLGSAEQALSESSIELEGIRAEIADAGKELAKAKDKLKDAQQTGAQVIADTQTRVEAMLAEAGQSVASIKADAEAAKNEAGSIVAAAKDQAQKIAADAETKAAAAEKRARDAEAQLSAIEARIASARAKAAEIIGG